MPIFVSVDDSDGYKCSEAAHSHRSTKTVPKWRTGTTLIWMWWKREICKNSESRVLWIIHIKMNYKTVDLDLSPDEISG